MVRVFTRNGFREEVYARNISLPVSTAFIKKHGKKKTEELCRQIMLNFREAPETVPSFEDVKAHTFEVAAQTRDLLKVLAQQRGLSISALVRESLHCKLLKKAQPKWITSSKRANVLVSLSPFEEKLLKQWMEISGARSRAVYLTTLACMTEPLPHVILPAQRPMQSLTLYPDPPLWRTFLHSTRVYGYLTSPLCHQILAFLDMPFDKRRVQDRYLDWLTGGYAHTLSCPF